MGELEEGEARLLWADGVPKRPKSVHPRRSEPSIIHSTNSGLSRRPEFGGDTCPVSLGSGWEKREPVTLGACRPSRQFVGALLDGFAQFLITAVCKSIPLSWPLRLRFTCELPTTRSAAVGPRMLPAFGVGQILIASVRVVPECLPLAVE